MLGIVLVVLLDKVGKLYGGMVLERGIAGEGEGKAGIPRFHMLCCNLQCMVGILEPNFSRHILTYLVVAALHFSKHIWSYPALGGMAEHCFSKHIWKDLVVEDKMGIVVGTVAAVGFVCWSGSMHMVVYHTASNHHQTPLLVFAILTTLLQPLPQTLL